MRQQPLLDRDPSLRREFDYYPTPAWMTRALVNRCRPFDVLEPCAGELAIVNALPRGTKICLTNDYDPTRPTDYHFDATDRGVWEMWDSRPSHMRHYWAVTNVPFDLADRIVPLGVEFSQVFATILRLSWLEPTAARQRFLSAHPPSKLIVMPRHDFKGRGATDSVTSAWFIWEQGRSSISSKPIEVVTKDERDELIALEKSTSGEITGG